MSAAKTATKSQAVSYSQVAPAPVVLLLGKESALADRAAEQLKIILKRQYADLEIHDCAADSAAPGQLQTLASPSLFGEPRLIRVAAADRAGESFIAEFKTVSNLLDSGTFIVLHHQDPARGKELLKLARNVSGMLEVNCQEIKKPAEKLQLVRQEAARLGAQIDAAAGQALVQAFSNDLAELFAVLSQLAINTGGKISVQAVQEITAGRVETTAFAVVDAALAGDSQTALTQLRHAISTGTELIPLLGAIGKSVRDMARVYGRRDRPADLAKELGLAPWMAEKAVRNAGRWQERDLALLIEKIAEVDLALKGDARDPQFALEQLVLQICRRGK